MPVPAKLCASAFLNLSAMPPSLRFYETTQPPSAALRSF
jgi:hypothetical protein